MPIGYNDITLKMADGEKGGFILSYNTGVLEGDSSYSTLRQDYREEIFVKAEGAAAIARMEELKELDKDRPG